MIATGYDWIEHRARLSPEKPAFVDLSSNKRLSYQEMDRRLDSIVSFFISNGLKKGDRIALLAPNDIAYFDLIFASNRIGTIFVPFNSRFGVHEIEYLMNDSKPTLFFVHSDYLSTLANMDLMNIKLIVLDDVEHSLQSFLSNLDTGKIRLKNNIIAAYQDVVNFTPIPFSKPYLSINDPWMIIYTGGTTGFPKGAVLTYRSVIWNSINTITSWGIGENEVTVSYLPLFHTGGINALSMPILHMGGTVVIARHFDPKEVIDVINSEKCTIILLVPTMYHMVIQTEEFQKASFPTMKIFLSGGAPCPLTIYDAFMEKGFTFKEGYGLTEAGPNNFYLDPKHVATKKGSVGMPMFYNEVKIVDDNGYELPADETGEIWLKGPHLFEYYWNKEKETKEAFESDWFKTGDLGRKDNDGFHYIVGRKKEMIISGGENIYPLEIENILQQHPAVNEVAVIGLPDDKWGEVVTAFISFKKGKSVSDIEFKEYLSTKIARYKIPKRYLFLEEIPKTAVGKIAKNQLKNEYTKKWQ